MTVEEYVNNPSGGRVGGLEREAYKKEMANRLDAVLVRENNDIRYECHKGTNSTYWLRVMVPSESTKGVYDDVVMKFSKPKNTVNMGSTSLNHSYQVQFFSNDPAFNFNHAYVYYKNGLLPNELKPKCSKVALKYRPITTNLHEAITYCKSIYWAILIAKMRGLFAVERYIQAINMSHFLNSIEDTDIHIQKRQEAKKDQAAAKRIAREQQQKSPKPTRVEGPNFNKVGAVDFNKGQKGGMKSPVSPKKTKKITGGKNTVNFKKF